MDEVRLKPVTIETPHHIAPDRVIDFDFTQIPGLSADFSRSYKSLHEPGVPGLAWTPHNEGHWIATRADVIKKVLSDFEHFSSRLVLIPKSVAEQAKFLPMTLDPPQHRPFRNLLNGALSPKVVDESADMIRRVARDLVKSIQAKGECNFVAEFAEPFPIGIFLGIMDLPASDGPRLKVLVDEVTRPTTMSFEDVSNAIREYFDPIIDQRIGSSGGDLITTIANGVIGDRPIDREEIFQMCLLVLGAGLDTVVNSLAFMMHFLARNPAHRAQLVRAPALISSAIDEFLRRFGIVMTAREVTKDMSFQGAELKKGELVAVPTWLGGLDDLANSDPMSIDFDRKNIVQTTFGGGVHSCPGKYLARTEIRIALEEWLALIPEFEIAKGETVQFSGGLGASVDSLPLVWNE